VSIDLDSIRAGIQTVLSTIPEIKRVLPYEQRGESLQNMPYATLLRGPVTGQGITLTGEAADHQLGGYDHLIIWHIRVYSLFRDQVAAQQMDDLLSQRLLDAFNGNRLIDPNGPGVVDSSRIPLIEPFVQLPPAGKENGQPPLWVTQAELQTFVIATL
jgi:hypothetical protein